VREARAVPEPTPTRRAAAAVAVVVAATTAVVAVGAGVAGSAPARAPVRRVLVLSLPGTTWAALRAAAAPNLDALVDKAAVGSTSVRAIERDTRPGDGYVTLGAGTAAAGVEGVEGLAFDAGEPLPPGRAAEAYRHRSPPVPAGGVVSVAGPDLSRDARGRHRGARIGALGDALERAGVARAVVGNADTTLSGADPA
jgi:hypothetical protein